MGEFKESGSFQLEYAPTLHEAKEARALMDSLSRHTGESLKMRVSGEAEITLAASTAHVLVDVLSRVATGESFVLMPSDKLYTTQQAGVFLGVSRPFVSRLLREGTMPFIKVGTHRRVRLKDLVAYKHVMESESYKAMEELQSQAQELGLGY